VGKSLNAIDQIESRKLSKKYHILLTHSQDKIRLKLQHKKWGGGKSELNEQGFRCSGGGEGGAVVRGMEGKKKH